MCDFSCLYQLTGDWSGALVLLITDRLQHWRLQQKMFFCWVLLFVCFFASLAFTEQYTSSWSLTGNRQLLSFWSKKWLWGVMVVKKITLKRFWKDFARSGTMEVHLLLCNQNRKRLFPWSLSLGYSGTTGITLKTLHCKRKRTPPIKQAKKNWGQTRESRRPFTGEHWCCVDICRPRLYVFRLTTLSKQPGVLLCFFIALRSGFLVQIGIIKIVFCLDQ